MFRMTELPLFLCLLLTALLLCFAALLWCILQFIAVLLQMYRNLTQQNDANRYTWWLENLYMMLTGTTYTLSDKINSYLSGYFIGIISVKYISILQDYKTF